MNAYGNIYRKLLGNVFRNSSNQIRTFNKSQIGFCQESKLKLDSPISAEHTASERNQGEQMQSYCCPPVQSTTIRTWQPAYKPYPDCLPIIPEPEPSLASVLLGLAIKALIFGSILYWTHNEGFWGDTKTTVDLYRKYVTAFKQLQLAEHVMEAGEKAKDTGKLADGKEKEKCVSGAKKDTVKNAANDTKSAPKKN